MNPLKIAEAVRGGLSPVCATCKKFWEGQERGLQGCTGRSCAGPLSGKDFPEYEGPISDFSRWCFVCGEESTCAVQAPQSIRMIGVCDTHIKMFRNSPKDEEAHKAPENLEFKDSEGSASLDELAPKRKQTVFEKIAEVEAEFEKEGK